MATLDDILTVLRSIDQRLARLEGPAVDVPAAQTIDVSGGGADLDAKMAIAWAPGFPRTDAEQALGAAWIEEQIRRRLPGFEAAATFDDSGAAPGIEGAWMIETSRGRVTVRLMVPPAPGGPWPLPGVLVNGQPFEVWAKVIQTAMEAED